jgi:hypothetical protein
MLDIKVDRLAASSSAIFKQIHAAEPMLEGVPLTVDVPVPVLEPKPKFDRSAAKKAWWAAKKAKANEGK